MLRLSTRIRRRVALYTALSVAGIALFTDPASATHTNSSSALGRLSNSFEQIAGRVSPSVVQIFTTVYATPRNGAAALITRQRGTGSGVILDADGYIVTNAHVVRGAKTVRVRLALSDETRHKEASILKSPGRMVIGKVVGVDLETDLAVVHIPTSGLPALPLADSDDVAQGQLVLAVGNPFGLNNSVTIGVISAVARQIEPGAPVVYIQTDATINPGNSGGPLVDADGHVVGINTMIFTQSGGSEGVGFAIPSNIVRTVYEQIRATGKVRRGNIGVFAQTIDPMLAQGLGLDRTRGAVLGDVYPGGPAAQAGLRIGDVMASVDGKPIENARQLNVTLYRKTIGRAVTVKYVRNGKMGTVRVPVAERVASPDRFADLVNPTDNLVAKLGILVLNITREIAQVLPGLRSSDGVVVAAQSLDGPGFGDRFQPGDIILSVNRQRIYRIRDFKRQVEELQTGNTVVIQIQRGPRLQFIAFVME